MNRRITVLAIAAIAVLGTIAIWRLVSLGEPESREPTRTEGSPAESSVARELEENEVPLGVTDADPARESAAAPVVAPPAAAAAPTTVLRVLAISASTRSPLPRVRLTVFPRDPAIETTSTDVEGSRGSFSESPVTGADGRAEFVVPPGIDVVLWVLGQEAQAESGPRDVAALRPDEVREMVVELATGNDLRFVGRVVRRADGSPVPDAVVEARSGEFGEPGAWGIGAPSDPEGYFELQLPSWQRPYVRVEAKGYGPAVVTPTKDHDSADRAFVIELDAGATLDARVFDASGKPIEGATLRLTARSFDLRRASGGALSNLTAIPEELRQGPTASDGRCVLADLFPAVRYSIEILRAGVSLRRETEPLVLAPGEVLEREFRIGAGGSFLGVVVDQQDAPVANLEIWLAAATSDADRFFQPHEAFGIGAKTTSNAEGRFAFRDVPPGVWSIGPGAGTPAEPSRSDVATKATRFEMLASEAQEITLRVHRGLNIRGRVVGPDGEPQKKALVWAWDAARSGLQANSGEDGAFVLGPLVPGKYTLLALGQGNLAPSDPVEASSGEEDVELRLRPGGSIRGRVVDARTGEGCQAEIRLALEKPGRGWNEHGTSWTNHEDGTFDSDGLEPGLYGISAGTKDGRFGILRSVGVTAGAETGDLVVAVAPGGKLRLRYEGKQTKVTCAVRFEGVPIGWAQEVSSEEPTERLVPAGTIDLQLRSEADVEIAARTVEIGAGEEKEIVFRDG